MPIDFEWKSNSLIKFPCCSREFCPRLVNKSLLTLHFHWRALLFHFPQLKCRLQEEESKENADGQCWRKETFSVSECVCRWLWAKSAEERTAQFSAIPPPPLWGSNSPICAMGPPVDFSCFLRYLPIQEILT